MRVGDKILTLGLGAEGEVHERRRRGASARRGVDGALTTVELYPMLALPDAGMLTEV